MEYTYHRTLHFATLFDFKSSPNVISAPSMAIRTNTGVGVARMMIYGGGQMQQKQLTLSGPIRLFTATKWSSTRQKAQMQSIRGGELCSKRGSIVGILTVSVYVL